MSIEIIDIRGDKGKPLTAKQIRDVLEYVKDDTKASIRIWGRSGYVQRIRAELTETESKDKVYIFSLDI